MVVKFGGGGSGETANHFQREFKVKIDKFETCQVKNRSNQSWICFC